MYRAGPAAPQLWKKLIFTHRQKTPPALPPPGYRCCGRAHARAGVCLPSAYRRVRTHVAFAHLYGRPAERGLDSCEAPGHQASEAASLCGSASHRSTSTISGRVYSFTPGGDGHRLRGSPLRTRTIAGTGQINASPIC